MRKRFRFANRKTIGVAAVSAALLVPLGVFGGSALAHGGPSGSQYQYRVHVCHHTGSRNHEWQMIAISNFALRAHLRHGDQMAPCPTPVFEHGHGHHGRGHGHGHGGSFLNLGSGFASSGGHGHGHDSGRDDDD
jgi:hypothetical protein